MPKHNGYKTVLTWIAAAFGVAIAVGGLGFFAIVGYAQLYEGRVFPGVRVLGVRLDGLTADEARATLHKAVDAALKDGLRFRYQPARQPDGQEQAGYADKRTDRMREVTLDATISAPNDPDLALNLISYDLDPAVVAAMGFGRSDNVFLDTLARWRARVRPVELQTKVDLDEGRVREFLSAALKDAVPRAQNATLEVAWNAATARAPTAITPERIGRTLKFEPALASLRSQAERLRFSPIVLKDQIETPSVTAQDVEKILPGVPAVLAHAPFKLTYDGGANEKPKIYTVTTSTLAAWVGAVSLNGQTTLTLDAERFRAGLRKLAPDIEKAGQIGSLVIEKGKVKSFKAGTEGVNLDDAATRRVILDAWSPSPPKSDLRLAGAGASFAILVTRQAPALVGADPERLGIKEIIGVGRSNMSGSPVNRRKNIANGVKKVNGTLIAPGEEFSLLKTLGPVTAENGWLPELVIKGNKTEPELGGGLCQIGTTAFRAALASGLPITQRQSHSYRVRYYEPAGTDATIYEPRPDFRFVNDTNNYILIHAYLDGDNVIYEFWGTKDGRRLTYKGQTEVTSLDKLKPKVFNITPPPSKKIIETLDLPPGKTKCTETEHAGADAEFTYTITYANGSSTETVFRSHYRPWQAVCLIGVEKLSEPPKEEGADQQSAEGSPDAGVVQ